jgi:cephalosporin-C deacetylase-like acetyl esterase
MRTLQLLCLLLFVSISIYAAEPANGTNSPGQILMQNWLKTEAVRLDGKWLEHITNKEEFETLKPRLRQQYMENLGLWPLPEKTPLNAQVTGTLEREEGFRVEKLHFQSRPGLYVTGNLYLPKNARAGTKLPAVLYVCGHSGRGRDGNKAAFQHHGMWFATHGYACLIIDTLQLGEIEAIHHGTYRHNRWWWQARGYTSAAVECWNGIRAIDYLQSRPEVDPDKIAVTGISGGGAATFWITAADDRVKVAVPVSGMSDLQEYVGNKVVNGHCDCMFMINSFQWPWTYIAALVAPRPMLFENSGHDTIFPMDGNDRIRARLEKLYGFYTNRTDGLFDIGVTPGGHEDNPELRLMAYRWINRFLKGDNSPVTEPELPKIEGKDLRAFPNELPKDELNSRIDETFVPAAKTTLPPSKDAFEKWRRETIAELKRISFHSIPTDWKPETSIEVDSPKEQAGLLRTEPGVAIPWKYLPGKNAQTAKSKWLVILGQNESLDSKPLWINKSIGDSPLLLVAPRGNGPMRFDDPPPFYVKRSLPLLGRTVDTCKLIDALAAVKAVVAQKNVEWKIAGSGEAGVIAAYAALLDPAIREVLAVEPPTSHRTGPIFLNVLRVVDIPEALGLIAPRQLTIITPTPQQFDTTDNLFRTAGGILKRQASP